MDCHSLLQTIFLTQGSNPCLLHWQADSLPLSHQGSLPMNGVLKEACWKKSPDTRDGSWGEGCSFLPVAPLSNFLKGLLLVCDEVFLEAPQGTNRQPSVAPGCKEHLGEGRTAQTAPTLQCPPWPQVPPTWSSTSGTGSIWTCLPPAGIGWLFPRPLCGLVWDPTESSKQENHGESFGSP